MNLKPFEATIFNRGKGIGLYISSSRLHAGSLVLILVFSLLFKLLNFQNQNAFMPVFMVLGITALIGSIWGTYSFEKKNGQLKGLLRMDMNHLSINDQTFNWESMSNISFNIGAIHGYDFDPSPYHRFRGGPRYSIGLNNWISFDYDSKNVKVEFQLCSLIQKEELEQILRYQFYLDRIALNHTYDGLHLSYEEIQRLKKEKANYLTNKA